jgi:geranylgeranyl diphosphate synthase type II
MKYECCKLAQKLVLCMPLISLDFFITYLEKQAITKEPENLYEPIAYILGRWKAHSSSSNANDDRGFNGDIKALPAAMAVEVS